LLVSNSREIRRRSRTSCKSYGYQSLSIRITGGFLKGRRIGSPRPGKGIRPTTDRVKLAIFSVIGLEAVEGRKVLDLFACTGALGIEAISRGADHVELVEKSRRNVQLIRDNIDLLGLSNQCTVHHSDVESFLTNCEDSYDMVTMDPPFETSNWHDLLNKIGQTGFVYPRGTVVAEHKNGISLEDSYKDITRFSLKTYGDSQVSFYEVKSG